MAREALDSSKFKIVPILLILCVCVMPLTVFRMSAVSGEKGGGNSDGGGGNAPPPRGGLGLPTGSFKLNQVLTGQNGSTCAYYNNFLLDANAGQQFKARLWTSGATIDYAIVPQDVFTSLRKTGCGYLSELSSQIQSFNSQQISLDWTAPQTGWFVVFFYSVTPYSGPIYCIPES